jgi:monovalent cation:H+ antiporter-2, CPA2 family
MAKRPDNLAYKELWLEKKYNRGPLLLIEIMRILVGVLLIAFWVFGFFSTEVATLIAVPVVIVVLVIFGKRIQKFYDRIEMRFLTNLNARESAAAADDSMVANIKRKREDIQTNLLPWDAHIVELEVPPNADYIGKALVDLGWREKYGINIVYIKRGEKLIHVPTRKAILLPYDHVGFIATDNQLQIFKPIFDSRETADGEALDIDEIALKKIVVDEHTKLNGLNISNANLRERTNGLVIGIQRGDERILNPPSTFMFQWGDVVWIVGERKKIRKLIGGESAVIPLRAPDPNQVKDL